jgi:hypothetical protein
VIAISSTTLMGCDTTRIERMRMTITEMYNTCFGYRTV